MQALIDSTGTGGLAPLLVLAAIYAVAALFSGLSGFGFSAIGCLSLAVLPPKLGITELMGLSLLTQASSLSHLWSDLRRHMTPWHRSDGVLPYLAGGLVGMPIGLAVLSSSGPRDLTAGLGVLLLAYAAWSLWQPVTVLAQVRRHGARAAFFVGAAGGVVGGFSAFPGAALVVWNSIVGTGKERGRALTQAFVLSMQIAALGFLLLTKPHLFGASFWSLFLWAMPSALLGNVLGIAIYRRTGDIGYRRVTLTALGLAGLGLVIRTAVW